MASERGVPAQLVAAIILEWKGQYGPTFPLYGNDTVRNDISGSVRPLLASTEISHEALLAERSSVSKRTIKKIMAGETKMIDPKTAEALVNAMDRNDVWHVELADYYSLLV